MEFDIRAFTEKASPLGQYLSDLERPGGILDRNTNRMAEAIVEATPIESERQKLKTLAISFANISDLNGQVTATIGCIESLRDALGDQTIMDRAYAELKEQLAELTGPDPDEWAGTMADAWGRLWGYLVEITGDVRNDRGYYARASVYSQAISDYAISRERHGHNIASLRFFDALREARK